MTDKRDDRLRKLLSSLPRHQAPPGFEEQLGARIAGGRARSAFPPAWLRASAVPALSVLLVGVISYVVYLTMFRTPGESLQQESDTVATPAVALPPEPSRGVQSLPESAPSGSEGRQATPQPRPKQRSQPKSTVEGGAPPSAGNGGSTGPGKLMMEQAVSGSGAHADSLARRDTSAADSALTPADSLRDSTRHPRPSPSY